MDTDLKWVRRLKGFAKRSKERLQCGHYRRALTTEECGVCLEAAVRSGAPFLAARFGSNEAKVASKRLRGRPPSRLEAERITNDAGVFPGTPEAIERFADRYLEAAREIDLLAVWYPQGEALLINRLGKDRLRIAPLRGLEPYYAREPWTRVLEGKRVLVVHPFKSTIESQYERRDRLFGNGLLPKFGDLTVLRAVQSIAGETPDHPDWCAALDAMTAAIDGVDFDVALIGAGAYGLPLGAHVRRRGKVAVHLGGALQILFGIKGRRWDEHPEISRLYNDAWTRPSEMETPSRGRSVEGGSYW